MDIGNALRRTGRSDITLRSTIASCIKEVYSSELSIESVKIYGDTITVRTGKPLINSELQLLEGTIKKASLEKLEKLGIRIGEDVRFRFV